MKLSVSNHLPQCSMTGPVDAGIGDRNSDCVVGGGAVVSTTTYSKKFNILLGLFYMRFACYPYGVYCSCLRAKGGL